jgi:hypothetical protein
MIRTQYAQVFCQKASGWIQNEICARELYQKRSNKFYFEDSVLLAYDGASLANRIPVSRSAGFRSTTDALSYARTEILLDTYVKILKLRGNSVFEYD